MSGIETHGVEKLVRPGLGAVGGGGVVVDLTLQLGQIVEGADDEDARRALGNEARQVGGELGGDEGGGE